MQNSLNRMNTVSVLGCGWLGKPLAISLLEKGFLVKGSTTSEEKIALLESLEIESYLIDIDDSEELDLFLNSDILIIAITSKNIASFERLIAQIVISTIKKVIFISSTSVYPNTNSLVTEDNETLKSDLNEIENLFRNNHLFETTILRFAGLFGPQRHPGNWFKGNKKIPQPDGFVNMIHQEDCIEIICQIILQNCWNLTLNACSNHHPTRREFYTKAKESLGFDLPIFEENSIISYKIIFSKKLQDTLSYKFKYDNLLNI